MDIYIKPARKVSVAGTEHVRVGDVCQVLAPDGLKERAEHIKLFQAQGKKRLYLVSALDIIAAVDQALPGHTVNNVGELDVIIEYRSFKKKDNVFWKWTKVAVISLLFAVGASTAIMSFHNDAEIPKVFKAYYKMFTGKETDKPRVIQIPYALGLAAGIIVFFNHFGGKNITGDLSPIEVEMSDYDKIVTEALVERLGADKGGGGHRGA